LGWRGDKLINVFDLLKSDLTVVNDLPCYYDANKFPPNVRFTGPLFSIPSDDAPVDPEIMEVFDPKIHRPKIFCTLSSSGSEEMLKDVIEALTFGPGLNWNAVILSPHFSVEKARDFLGGRRGVYITDKFVPALKINALADVTISHGGQGTLQTALYSGTPVVGLAAQQEQFINLSNFESHGAGIRTPRNRWNAKNMQKSVSKILSNAHFGESAQKLSECIKSSNGAKNAADAILEAILQLDR
jgi:UDP:flavonoid glycosyltransferase YjiC (YdhE family)